MSYRLIRNRFNALRDSLGAVHRAAAGTVLTNLGVQALLLVTGIIAARLLGPYDRGQLALLQLAPVVLSHLGSLGLASSITYYIAKEPGSAASVRRTLVRSAAPHGLILITLHAAILWPFLHGESSDIVVSGVMSLVLTPVNLFQIEALSILQGQRRFRAFNVLRVLRLGLYAAGLVAAAIADSDHLAVVMLVWVVANVVAMAAEVAYVLRGFGKRGRAVADGPRLREMIRFGLRALLGTASPVETLRIDQAAVGLFLSPFSLGLYVAALAFTNLPRFIANGMGRVATPYVASNDDAEAATRLVWWFFRVTMVPVLLAILLLELSAGLLVPLAFGDEFTDAVGLVHILLVATAFVCGRRILSDGLRGAGYPGLGSLAEGVSWLWLAPLLAVLTPLWGATGVAWALTGSAAISLGYLLLLSGIHGQLALPAFIVGPAYRGLSRMRLAGRAWTPPGGDEPPSLDDQPAGEAPLTTSKTTRG